MKAYLERCTSAQILSKLFLIVIRQWVSQVGRIRIGTVRWKISTQSHVAQMINLDLEELLTMLEKAGQSAHRLFQMVHKAYCVGYS